MILKLGKVFVFNSCKIDIETSEEKYISKINLGRAVRASCTYPFVFSPCPYFETCTGRSSNEKIFKKKEKGEKLLLDGGIKENLAWKELNRIGISKIISINFSKNKSHKCCDNLVEIGMRSFELMSEELNRQELEDIDFLHTITLNGVGLLDTNKMDEIYEEGYIQTKQKMHKIKKYIQK